MADGDYFEFSIAHDRKYTLEHLWLQALDDKGESVKVGISEFIRAEYGDIVRAVLTRPEDDSEFKGESDDEDADDDAPRIMGGGDEVGVEDLLITVTTNYDGEIETLLFNSPFPCKIVELNGEVEDNPDLLNDDAYGDGWCVIVQPHMDEVRVAFDEDQFLDQEEYIEMLNELP